MNPSKNSLLPKEYVTLFVSSYKAAAHTLFEGQTMDTESEATYKAVTNAQWSEEAQACAEKECLAFINRAELILFALNKNSLGAEQAGTDFWLTRNHHGAGFWDRNLGDDGKHLSEIAISFKESDVELGDDGQLHFLGQSQVLSSAHKIKL
jgi:hypothetical protein